MASDLLIMHVLFLQVTVFFDTFFITQHFVLYPANKAYKSVALVEPEDEIKEHLVSCAGEPRRVENV